MECTAAHHQTGHDVTGHYAAIIAGLPPDNRGPLLFKNSLDA